VTVVVRIAVGALLVAHGLVHLLFVADDVPEFTFEGSWLLPDAAARTIGLALMAATIGVFALAGLAVWGVPGLAGNWPVLTIVGAAVSLALLGAFWHVQMVFGAAIDVALIALAVLQPDWWTDGIR
jgi:hypothetical protein